MSTLKSIILVHVNNLPYTQDMFKFTDVTASHVYRVVQKRIPFYFWDNFGNSAPILTILSLLQTEIYGA